MVNEKDWPGKKWYEKDWHCTKCGRYVKKIADMMDVIGYEFVQGKCRECASRDPRLTTLFP